MEIDQCISSALKGKWERWFNDIHVTAKPYYPHLPPQVNRRLQNGMKKGKEGDNPELTFFLSLLVPYKHVIMQKSLLRLPTTT